MDNSENGIFPSTFGRTTIYANIREKELLSANIKDQTIIIAKILENSKPIHEQNRAETDYLRKFLYGRQDIYHKQKQTRIEINNKSVENWAWALGETKKAILVGKPIIYAAFDNVINEEITELNKYISNRDKETLDQETYDELYFCGRSYRYTWTSEDEEAPFDILNPDILNTEVVYSSSIKHEQLFEYIVTPKMYQTKVKSEDTNQIEVNNITYYEYQVYTRNNIFTFNDKNGNIQINIKDGNTIKPNIYNEHVITERYFNKYRISCLEINKDIFNDINYIESLDKDDFEAYVNSIMVFTNVAIDEKKMEAIQKFKALSVKSTNDKKGSVELLQSRLRSSDTQAFYLRKLFALYAISGVPQLSGNDSGSNAETGKAAMLDLGFTASNLRSENEEKAFKKGDRQSLKMIIKICKANNTSKIKELEVSDVNITFDRDLSDSILTKTQALQNLYGVNIPPEVANSVINLFSDPVKVTKLQEKYLEVLDKQEEEKQIKFQNKQIETQKNINEQRKQEQKSIEEQDYQ